jgi:hypothetical protein
MRGRLAATVAVAMVGGAGGALGGGAGVALGTAGPSVRTDRGCYTVGAPVGLTGTGFAPHRNYDVTVDGVDFGQAGTDTGGGFSTHFVPGGLPAGVPQRVDRLDVSDGTSEATTSFTVTRPTGARFEAARGKARALRAPFQAWGFSLDGTRRTLYVHYVSPAGRARATMKLGRTIGRCGYLVTPPLRVFPFTPSVGRWTLQVDAAAAYSARPGGPVARITVVIGRG